MTKRMISLEVVDTDAFLDMPQSSQLLYFHLNARADDDGFVANPKRVMRDMGSQLDDIKLLVAKKFLISFEDGVVVIKHWRINNYIRKDIYKETKYLNHRQTLFIRPNGAYTLTDDGRAKRLPNGHFQLEDIKVKNALPKPRKHVHEASTERALSIGKISIDKVRIDTTLFERFWLEYPNKKAKKKALQSWDKLKVGEPLFENIMAGLSKAKVSSQWQKDGGLYVPHPATWLNQERWNDEIAPNHPSHSVVKI